MTKYEPVFQLEKELAEFTGAPYGVSTSSCADAIFMCLKWCLQSSSVASVLLPKHTSLSVLSKVRECGLVPEFIDRPEAPNLRGAYQLLSFPIIDSALLLYRGMYQPGHFVCLSFSGENKPLFGHRGGMILTDNKDAADWFEKARYFGSGFNGDRMDVQPEFRGWNFYLMPSLAEAALQSFRKLDKDKVHCKELPYPDLSKMKVYL